VELHDLYTSPSIIRAIKSGRMTREENVACIGEMKSGKHEGKRPLGSPRRRWEDNIRMNFREIRWEVMGYIHLAQDTDQ